MFRAFRCLAYASLAFALGSGTMAHAQYNYPPGYGGYGWNGWGGGSTAGRSAAGMGAFAAGAGQAAAGVGQRNVDNSQARATNAQTAMGVNNYVWECQQRNNQAYYSRKATELKNDNNALANIQDRILNHPNEIDIANGDSLNALYSVITDPNVYAQTLELAQKPMRGAVIKQIPFNSAGGGITYSLMDLTHREIIPAVLNRPVFADQRAALKAIVIQLKKEADTQENPQPETTKKFRTALDGIKATLEDIDDLDGQEKFEAEKYLKALYGLTRMIDSPSFDVYLAAVGREPSVPLGEVLIFMHSFNLRFGPATTPETRELYSQLYGTFQQLRQGIPQAAQASIPNPPPPQGKDDRATNFFANMSYDHARGPTAPAGAQPPPRGPQN